MRERSTWNREEVLKKAAIQKKADPYTMNQDHPQPAADKYVTGDPSTFAEDVHTPNTWESEYSGDEVKRNEIGMPEMRSDTFNHSEKTASQELLMKKADLCIAVSRMLLAGKKTASETAVEDQSVALMSIPDRELIATYRRLAEEQEEQSEEQAKQAQDQDQGQGQEQQAKQAQEQQEQQEQAKQAQSKLSQDQIIQQIQAGNLQAAQEQIQQMMQQQAQGQQQIQQQQVQQQGQQQQPVQQQQQVQSDAQVLDQMLAQDSCGPTSETDIEMEPSPMDVGMDDLGPDDEVLRTLFAQDQDQDQGQGQEQQKQQKQASIRTASTRTVGTRPTAGVARIGGGASSPSQNSVDTLSSLWQSAPDVREAFGLK